MPSKKGDAPAELRSLASELIRLHGVISNTYGSDALWNAATALRRYAIQCGDSHTGVKGSPLRAPPDAARAPTDLTSALQEIADAVEEMFENRRSPRIKAALIAARDALGDAARVVPPDPGLVTLGGPNAPLGPYTTAQQQRLKSEWIAEANAAGRAARVVPEIPLYADDPMYTRTTLGHSTERVGQAVQRPADGSAWIPVTERQPPKDEKFLAVVDGLIRFMHWGKTSHVPMYGYCLADQGDEDFAIDHPTHWMPLPEPPTTASDTPHVASEPHNQTEVAKPEIRREARDAALSALIELVAARDERVAAALAAAEDRKNAERYNLAVTRDLVAWKLARAAIDAALTKEKK